MTDVYLDALKSPRFQRLAPGANITLTDSPSAGNVTLAVSRPFLAPGTVVTSTPYTVLSTDGVLLVDASGGAKNILLPIATGSGRTLTVKKTDSSVNAVTVTADTTGVADTIDGAATQVIDVQYVSLTIYDGAANLWSIL